ncbi:hypothetical protein ABW21_db0209464 [Orbilia brochopaga]|nr:hypothetical protein ABW21_db0209464 [Drechslerella brochopaga]
MTIYRRVGNIFNRPCSSEHVVTNPSAACMMLEATPNWGNGTVQRSTAGCRTRQTKVSEILLEGPGTRDRECSWFGKGDPFRNVALRVNTVCNNAQRQPPHKRRNTCSNTGLRNKVVGGGEYSISELGPYLAAGANAQWKAGAPLRQIHCAPRRGTSLLFRHAATVRYFIPPGRTFRPGPRSCRSSSIDGKRE